MTSAPLPHAYACAVHVPFSQHPMHTTAPRRQSPPMRGKTSPASNIIARGSLVLAMWLAMAALVCLRCTRSMATALTPSRPKIGAAMLAELCVAMWPRHYVSASIVVGLIGCYSISKNSYLNLCSLAKLQRVFLIRKFFGNYFLNFSMTNLYFIDSQRFRYY